MHSIDSPSLILGKKANSPRSMAERVYGNPGSFLPRFVYSPFIRLRYLCVNEEGGGGGGKENNVSSGYHEGAKVPPHAIKIWK